MRNFLSNACVAALSVAMASGLVMFADPANADVGSAGAPRMIVATADLDLQTPAGVAAARHRIHAAADRVCSFDGDAMSVSGQCRAKALQDAGQRLQDQIAAR